MVAMALNMGKTNDQYLRSMFDLYGLLDIGVTINIDDLPSRDAEMLLIISDEVAKRERMQQMMR
jgi:hypothetical protein